MRLSEDKVNHLSHLIAYALDDLDGCKFNTDMNTLRRLIRDTITAELSVEDRVDATIRARLKKRRGLVENSDEWNILYRQEFEAEMGRRQG